MTITGRRETNLVVRETAVTDEKGSRTEERKRREITIMCGIQTFAVKIRAMSDIVSIDTDYCCLSSAPARYSM